MILFKNAMSLKMKFLATLSAGVLLALGQSAFGQADFPNLQGSGQRTGHNADPINYNSGATFLQWFTGPAAKDIFGTITVDDSGVGVNGLGNNFGSATSFPALGTWQTPAVALDDAFGAYNPTLGAAYHYAPCVPALDYNDPAVPATGVAATYSFTVVPAALGFTENYAVYASIPIGPTTISGNPVYPQRYFVYQVHFGNGLVATDVVDTYATGFGFVRLGGGGHPTNTVYPYDGINPITVTLLNTIPYNSDGSLSTGTATTAGNYLVYADGARAVPSPGYYSASPTSAYRRDLLGNPMQDPIDDVDVSPGTPYIAHITSALNQAQGTFVNGNYQTTINGLVRNYLMNPKSWATPPTAGANGVPDAIWTWQPATSTINSVSADGTPTAGWTTGTLNSSQGAGYYVTPLALTATASVNYAPSLNSGYYSIYAYLPGSITGEKYGTQVTYQILQGGTVISTGTLDENLGGGWVQLGTSTWYNDATVGAPVPLTINLTNKGSDADVAAALNAYASSVKFVPSSGTFSINSSPVHAQVPIQIAGVAQPVLTQVVIVADENGHIHCLDENGNGDGTTTEYWSYPTIADPAGDPDPNLTSGIDGVAGSTVPSAAMPTQFNLSTAIVQPVTFSETSNGVTTTYTNYCLYITSQNGRVYCLDMTGRGDYVSRNNNIGTTQRIWSYPDDYPLTQVNSKIGAIRGSLVYGDSNQGVTNPTIYVPGANGRLYSLDAVGNRDVATGTNSTRSTTLNWSYPATTSTTLPPIEMTPVLSYFPAVNAVPAFSSLSFGTITNPNSGASGTVYSLDPNTGAIQWTFNGAVNGATTGTNVVSDPNILDWVSGPTSASAATLSESVYGALPYQVNPQDSIYYLNSNSNLYGFNARTGQLLTDSSGAGVTYDATIPASAGVQNLGINVITTYDRTGVLRRMPLVMVPTASGAVIGMFANPDEYNVFQATNTTAQLYAWGYNLYGDPTSLAFSNKRMIAGDSAGYMYVWDNNSAGYGLETAGVPPPGQTLAPNNNSPDAQAFRNPKVAMITVQGFNEYSTVNTVAPNVNQPTVGTDTYDQVVTGHKYWVYPNAPAVAPAFELGQTAYLLVYDFPYQPNTGNVATNGESVNVRVTVNGITHLVVGTAHQFNNPAASPTLPGADYPDDAYAVVTFPFNEGSGNAFPPGPGTFAADVTTSAFGGASQEIVSNPKNVTPFQINNPFAITVTNPQTGQLHDYALTINPFDFEAQTNGTPNSATDPEGQPYTSQLLQSLGFAQDGGTQTMAVKIWDRSLTPLLHGPGQGLSNVRMDRSDLQWQGSSATEYNPLLPNLYPGFEDRPVNYPNNSLDYPNISRDRLSYSSSNTNGSIQNPAQFGIQLSAPYNVNNGPLVIGDDFTKRKLNATTVQVSVNVPKFQPGVYLGNLPAGTGGTSADFPDDLLNRRYDSTGQFLPQGYFGLGHVFLDDSSSVPGTFTTADAYRQFFISTGVTPDWNIQVTTPSINLGSLSSGTGYDPLSPYANTGTFNPIIPLVGQPSSFAAAYQPFGVMNLGNINLLDLHLAKVSTVDTNAAQPWGFYSGANDVNAWLDASLDLWSNLDLLFAPNNPNITGTYKNNVFLQKARVTDGVGSSLAINPKPRINGNVPLSLKQLPLNSNVVANQTPLVGVSVPLGFPSGIYSSNLKVVDDALIANAGNTGEEVWEKLLGLNTVEPNSDPALNVSFTSRETRVTNSKRMSTSVNVSQSEPIIGAPLSDNFIDQYIAANTATNNTTTLAVPPYAPSYSNPTAMRDSYGSIIAAWSSNLADFPNLSPQTAPPASLNDRKISIWSLGNKSSFGANGITINAANPITNGAITSPLADLDFWMPDLANSRWFTNRTPGGTSYSFYPAASIMPSDNTGAVIGGTEAYDAPSFPVSGSKDSISGTDLGYEYMAFVGTSQRQSPSGRIAESHVFMTEVKSGAQGTVQMDAANGAPWNTSFLGNAQLDDPTSGKGKPTVVQTNTGAMVLYSVTAGNNSGIHYSRYSPDSATPGFGNSVPINFGLGFDSTSEPKAIVRKYQGTRTDLTPNLMDLTFTGKLRGRPNSDIYLAQMRVLEPTSDTNHWQVVDSNGTSIETAGANTPFAFFSQQTNELLTAENGGVYRSKGVEWDRTKTIALVQYVNGVPSDLLIENTRNSDRETGMLSYDTTFGGKVYIDPELGTVRFSQANPPSNADLRLTYTPGFLRVSKGGSGGYSEPTGIFENNYTSDATEWFSTNGAAGQQGTANVFDGRFVFTYGVAAANHQTAQPQMSTMRFGVRLPYRIAVGNGGIPAAFQVTGNVGPYQLDPANGRIYFTAADEDNVVSIVYTGVDEASGNPIPLVNVQQVPVSFVTEQGEHPILIDKATNESNLCTFLDPFTYQGNSRPALFWMFYTSLRGGVPDIYFQTIAPRFAPVIH